MEDLFDAHKEHTADAAPFYRDKSMIRMIIMGCLLLITAIGELVTGVRTGSLALIADAWHVMADELAIGVGFLSLYWVKKRRTKEATYGWARAEVIGALINGVFLMSVSVFIILSALERFFEPQELEEPWLIMIVGGIGLLVNLSGLFIFHGGHSHSGGHSHEVSLPDDDFEIEEIKTKNLNIHGVFLHILGDTLGSVAAISSGFLTWYFEWQYFDPILSLCIALIIIKSSSPLIKKCIMILLQKVPSYVDIDKLIKELLELDGVSNIHDIHVWTVRDYEIIATMHVAFNHQNTTRYTYTVNQISRILHKYGIHSTTIQPEFIQNSGYICQHGCKAIGEKLDNCCEVDVMSIYHS